jgi:hypothetical protein
MADTPPVTTPPNPTAPPNNPAPPAPDKAPAPSPFSSLADKARTVKADPAPEPDKGTGGGDKQPGDAAPVVDKGAPAKETPKWYREQISLKSSEAEKATKRVQELEQKISAYESKGLDTTALTEQLTAREKALQAAQSELAAIRYEKSDDYKKKYDQPFSEAADYAKQVIENLNVIEGDEERPAKWNDFAAIWNLPPGRAEMEAQKQFGPAAAVVLRHLDKLRDLDHARKQALKDHEAGAVERDKATRASEAQRAERVNSAWKMAEKDLLERNPDHFGEKPGDDDRNALWKESLSLVDQAYVGRGKLNESELIVLDANVRLQAAAYPVLVREIAHLKHQMDQYKIRLGEKEASRPGAGKGKAAEGQSPAPKDWKTEMKELQLITP